MFSAWFKEASGQALVTRYYGLTRPPIVAWFYETDHHAQVLRDIRCMYLAVPGRAHARSSVGARRSCRVRLRAQLGNGKAG